jgi:hypothetical protein
MDVWLGRGALGCCRVDGLRAFQCTGADAVKAANTNNSTVVLLADFCRQGTETSSPLRPR